MSHWTDPIFSSDLSKEQALELVRNACEKDPRNDLCLLDRARDQPRFLPFVLRLLSYVSNCQRLVPALLPLLHSSMPQTREWAALLIARGRQDPSWARQMLDDPDPRVRADVVEDIGTWSVDVHTLNRAVKDEHHRVVCNGIVAMYRIRPRRARVLLKSQLANEDWRFRAAAAWACGAIGDPELQDWVRTLRRDPHPSVRWNALRALSALHRAVCKMP